MKRDLHDAPAAVVGGVGLVVVGAAGGVVVVKVGVDVVGAGEAGVVEVGGVLGWEQPASAAITTSSASNSPFTLPTWSLST